MCVCFFFFSKIHKANKTLIFKIMQFTIKCLGLCDLYYIKWQCFSSTHHKFTLIGRRIKKSNNNNNHEQCKRMHRNRSKNEKKRKLCMNDVTKQPNLPVKYTKQTRLQSPYKMPIVQNIKKREAQSKSKPTLILYAQQKHTHM